MISQYAEHKENIQFFRNDLEQVQEAIKKLALQQEEVKDSLRNLAGTSRSSTDNGEFKKRHVSQQKNVNELIKCIKLVLYMFTSFVKLFFLTYLGGQAVASV